MYTQNIGHLIKPETTSNDVFVIRTCIFLFFSTLTTIRILIMWCFLVIICAFSTSRVMSVPLTKDNVCEVCRCKYGNNTVVDATKITIRGEVTIDCSMEGKCNTSVTNIPDPSRISGTVVTLIMSSCTYIGRIDHYAFRGYGHLQTLDLKNTGLQKGTFNMSSLESLTKLQVLDISQNEQIPLTNDVDAHGFDYLRSLKTFRIYGTTGTYLKSKSYPAVIVGALTSLETLELDGFTENSFGPEFRSLTTLRIYGDLIVPSWRSTEFCCIDKISNSFLQHLANVSELVIKRCHLTQIEHRAFSGMFNLKKLDLSDNTLLTVAGAFPAMQSLQPGIKELVLDNIENTRTFKCGKDISWEMTRSLQNLTITTLKLGGNFLSRVSHKVFEMLPRTLEHLYIPRNRFATGFYVLYFFQLKNLRTVNMQYNFMYNTLGVFRNEQEPNTKAKNEVTHGHSLSRSLFRENISADNAKQLISGSDFKFPTPMLETTKKELADKAHHRCPRQVLPPGTFTAYLPPRLEEIDISYSKLAYPIKALLVANNTLRKFRAVKCMLYCWDGPLLGFDALEDLDLSQNSCPTVNVEFFGQLKNLRALNLTGNLLGGAFYNKAFLRLFENNTKLEILSLRFINIWSIHRNMFIHQSKLKVLDLSDNKLECFPVTIKHMRHLDRLDLRRNHIFNLTATTREEIEHIARIRKANNASAVPLVIDMRGNPLMCRCDSLEFLRWIFKHQNSDEFRVRIAVCFYNKNGDVHDLEKSENSLEDLVLKLEKECASYATLMGVLVAMFVIIVNSIVAFIVHRNRWKIRYWYYVLNSETRVQTNERPAFKHDIYIAYENSANEFVEGQLLPRLQNIRLRNKKPRVFLQQKDIMDGQNMSRVISNTINVTRVVLSVVSSGCDTVGDWQAAMNFAQVESCYRTEPFVLVIFLYKASANDWPEILNLIRRRFEKLHFPTNGNERVVEDFWNKLSHDLNKMLVTRTNNYGTMETSFSVTT